MIVVKNHISDIKASTLRMLLNYSDDRPLLYYFRELHSKLEIMEQLIERESKLDWTQISDAMNELLVQDDSITTISVNFKLKGSEDKRKANLTVNME